MKIRRIPTYLSGHLAYDPESPSGLVWTNPRHPRIKIGDYPGRQLNLMEGSFPCSRIVWFLHHGDPGDVLIDHIDRDRSNNRIENLRPATPAQNQMNRGTWGASSYKGVRPFKKKWRATFCGAHLGVFITEEAAAAAYNEAAQTKFGDYAILNNI